MAAIWVPWKPMSLQTAVSVLTVLMPFSDPGDRVDTLLFECINDGPEDAWLRIETSADGIVPDFARAQVISMPAGQGASLEVGPKRTRRWWRVSAYTTSPAFPVTQVRWKVTAVTWGG